MPIEIKLQEIGDNIESGDVLEVLVREGDNIKKDQDIVELETDKATMGVPSPHAGKVLKVHIAEGDTVPVGGVLITLETNGDAAEPAPKEEQPKKEVAAEKKPPAEEKAPPKAQPAPDEEEDEEPAPKKEAKPAAKKEAPAPKKETRPEPAADDDEDEAGDNVPAGPGVRRLAREMGVDLSRVSGSGPKGRIVRDDVMKYVRQSDHGHRSGPAKTSGESDQFGPVRIEKMPKIRKTIANKMHESWVTAPRVTNFDDADITDLEKFRQGSKNDYADKGIKLTTMPFVLKAVAMALKNHPAINASVDMEQGRIIYKEYVNLGVAVDTDRGLVVPVIREAGDLSIPEMAKSLADLAEKVRSNEFERSDLQGGTFTISNLGAIGGTYSTPIINVPEVAILLLGRARKLPVIIDDKVEVRLMMPLSLSYDHRLVDGATAARFLNDIISYLKAPSRLLLAP
ncbi:2-oxo acid dehydrogenase subunit E2 [Lignipirellula cremea]|uniref:Dihydrolipoamide acetyltransferase component of pyruvate dehydrogenase complex n=1 Tax=Lignipirellula cremea TaxID=2528010 RepID=A0A518DZH5_9BACT|nr:2-oxo acid dehydrogenase subunit E2 [Lignipirellula cremea]QDU97229.1 Dihydrolipoyllysine-residue acetyltransferase component of pyruvate dehydrogenase complex [Lignipirellula cremea]